MAKYNMDGISDAYFGSSKQYNDYTKYLKDREEEKLAKQAAINENNKRMSIVSASHYPHNEKSARVCDVSPAYIIGAGASYEKAAGYSYGKAVKKHLPFIMKYCLQDWIVFPKMKHYCKIYP